MRPVFSAPAQTLAPLSPSGAPRQAGSVYLRLMVRDRPGMMEAVIETVTFGASASLLWWFGERAQNPRGRK